MKKVTKTIIIQFFIKLFMKKVFMNSQYQQDVIKISGRQVNVLKQYKLQF